MQLSDLKPSDYVVYTAAVLVLATLLLFVNAAIFRRRPQKAGLFLALLTVPLFALYYNDRPPLDQFSMRGVLAPLERLRGADAEFHSNIAPAILIGFFLVVRVTVFQRVAVRRRLQRLHDQIANFFGLAPFATLIAAIIVSAFHWGWIGALIVGAVFVLVYLGVLALVAAFIEVGVEVGKLISVWVKRKIFTLGTAITRIASFVSSLSGRLVSRLLIDRIRAETARQTSIFAFEQDSQDQMLEDKFDRDRARRKRQPRGKAAPEPVAVSPPST